MYETKPHLNSLNTRVVFVTDNPGEQPTPTLQLKGGILQEMKTPTIKASTHFSGGSYPYFDAELNYREQQSPFINIQLHYGEEHRSRDPKAGSRVKLFLKKNMAQWFVDEGYFSSPDWIDLTIKDTPNGPQYIVSSRALDDQYKGFELDIEDLHAMGIPVPEVVFTHHAIELKLDDLHLAIDVPQFSLDRLLQNEFAVPITATKGEKDLLTTSQIS